MHKSNIWVKLSRYIIVIVAFYCYYYIVLEEDAGVGWAQQASIFNF